MASDAFAHDQVLGFLLAMLPAVRWLPSRSSGEGKEAGQGVSEPEFVALECLVLRRPDIAGAR
jgi:hypothetical protein